MPNNLHSVTRVRDKTRTSGLIQKLEKVLEWIRGYADRIQRVTADVI